MIDYIFMNSEYGLIGKKLDYSYSKNIHDNFRMYEYDLIELNEEEFISFMEKKEFKGINVTIPYKKEVMKYISKITEKANRIGAVNTIVNVDGSLYGYNTDYFGLRDLIIKTFDEKKRVFEGKRVVILGTGGTGNTAKVVCEDMKAKEIVMVSREKKEGVITYDELYKNYKDVDFIINTTPIGTFPNVDETPIDISDFTNLSGIIDVVYNPLNTRLVLDARKKGIKATNGLYMLVVQAATSCAIFQASINREKGNFLTDNIDLIDNIYEEINNDRKNIVLIGMPGVGKTTYGEKLAEDMKREFIDTDVLIEEREHMTPEKIIEEKGEDYFRQVEVEIIRGLKLKKNVVISTGGGAIIRDENVYNLKYNGELLLLNRSIDDICADETRPLSDTREKLEKLYEERKDRYNEVADRVMNI